MKKDDDFLKRLLATFKIEAQEHVNALYSGLIELEKETPEKQEEIIEAVFREVHSLKGAARSVSIIEIESICQSMESVLSALKRQELSVSAALLDVIHHAVDNLSHILHSMDRERTADEKSLVSETSKTLEGILKGAPVPQNRPGTKNAPVSEDAGSPDKTVISSEAGSSDKEPVPIESKPAVRHPAPVAPETIRVPASRLESLLLQTEELLLAKQTAGQLVTELRGVNNSLAEVEQESTKLYPHMRAARHLLGKENGNGHGKINSHLARLLEFLDWNQSSLNALKNRLEMLTKTAENDHRVLDGAVDNLLQDMMRASMLPLSSLFEIFPKFVRDLCRDQDKDVELIIRGQEIEIDRRILEEMKDPFIHLIRNCIDHGVEKPEKRKHKGKPPRGTVIIAASQTKSNSVDIMISDDGAGIDVDKVRETALRHGILSKEEADKSDEQRILSLIYKSGVSTSPIITDISGRGLGLAIVREKVGKIGGTISVETQRDAGSTFRFSLPLTTATFRGILVRTGENLFIIPTRHLERGIRVHMKDIKTVENRETVRIDGQVLSLVRLADVLELPREESSSAPSETLPAVILASADIRIVFLLDEIINEQEVLVKSLGKQLSSVRNILGASILATGKIAPVLNVSDLVKSAVKASSAPARIPLANKVKVKKKSILVVEDSITARTLLKNILESAGYRVKTSVDGIDGFTALKTQDFDLVVSDVDMPRMNGFDLTAKIRDDRKLENLPVILVTALESREHRERGIEVGANAYIVKSSFDQSNLLETIKRLI